MGAVLTADEMPDDNADLAHIAVEFERLPEDLADSCPVPITDLLRYLADEAPGGEKLRSADLRFLRTAQVAERRYWIWEFNEPEGGDRAFATVSVNEQGQVTIGYDADYYGLTPEQFMLGDYHVVF